MSFFRPEIEAMAGYVPGEQPQDGEFIKLNTNENPYPPSPAVARAIEEAAQRLAKISRPDGRDVPPPRGRMLGVEPDWILCGNGSDDILTIVTRALVGQGQLLRLPYPSYILYKTLAELQGARSEEVHFNADWSLPAAFAAAGATICGWCFWPIRTAPRARWFRREKVLEIARAVAVPAAGRRGVRRFRRDELHEPGGPVREDHGLAVAEQVVRAGRAAVRLPGGAAAR